MSEDDIPDEVRNFIIEFISSVGQLEVLLFLYTRKEKSWSAEMIAEEMRSSSIAAARQLKELHSRHLVSQLKERGQERYQFSPECSNFESIVSKLANCYTNYRVSIITLIYNKPLEVLRRFANAFIIKKDK